ncbi:non-heme iron oxygenase ferredoxin subunit [Bradyrhizobium sp. DOA9]|uniref:non-heme iron oxygenase ferredoxin subunit n=1 Tax=Bradyrhizobium sp. DOA9 TaxID=1126627 RepID=UPI0004682B17|nr:non-heme iron oxygenase ferredoxin subunit [Bradyrhizobium sp. DOA9]GAJ37978.1 naphthalene 1,2-dioxygenase system ferredoxin component [Bradyrhizobium sp. DOA9]
MNAKFTWHVAAALADIKQGEAIGLEIAGHHVALYRVGDQFYATGNICTHADALLSDGMLDECEIECPLHMGRFDIRTGEALTSPVEIDIPTYQVRIRDDQLEVCLPN